MLHTMWESLKPALLVINGKGSGLQDAPDLRKALALLDQVAHNVDNDLPPRLRHFLQKRSYQKALLFVEGEHFPEELRCGNHHALKE